MASQTKPVEPFASIGGSPTTGGDAPLFSADSNNNEDTFHVALDCSSEAAGSSNMPSLGDAFEHVQVQQALDMTSKKPFTSLSENAVRVDANAPDAQQALDCKSKRPFMHGAFPTDQSPTKKRKVQRAEKMECPFPGCGKTMCPQNLKNHIGSFHCGITKDMPAHTKKQLWNRNDIPYLECTMCHYLTHRKRNFNRHLKRHPECDIIHVDESDSMSIGEFDFLSDGPGEFDFLLSDGPGDGNNVGNNPENLKLSYDWDWNNIFENGI